MGCVGSKQVPPTPDVGSTPARTGSAPEMPEFVESVQHSNDEPTTASSSTPGDSLLALAMGSRTKQPHQGIPTTEGTSMVVGGGIQEAGHDYNLVATETGESPVKTRARHSILGDEPSEEAMASSMLTDVSYSMRSQQGPGTSPRLGIPLHPELSTQSPGPVASARRGIPASGAMKVKPPHGLQPLVGPTPGTGGQMPVQVPLQQPQVARGPGWVAVPMQRGRGTPLAVGYRGSQLVSNAPMQRGSPAPTRGRGRPLHVLVPGDRSGSHGGLRRPFPTTGSPPPMVSRSPSAKSYRVEGARGGESADSDSDSDGDDDDDDDDDDDLVDDDEEVADWDLGDEDGGGDEVDAGKATKSSEATESSNFSRSQSQSVGFNPGNASQQQESQEFSQAARLSVSAVGSPQRDGAKSPAPSTSSPSPPPRRRKSSGIQPKFRPALELADDIELVESDSSCSSLDSDDDGSNTSEGGIHDWLDGPSSTRSHSPPPVSVPTTTVDTTTSASTTPKALVSSISPQKEITTHHMAVAAAPRRPSARRLYGLTIAPPSDASSPVQVNDATPQPSPSLQQPPSRMHGSPTRPPIPRQGNMSPTRSAGATMHAVAASSPSPVKQSSYRSGIVSNAAPAVVPLTMIAAAGEHSPIKVAPSPNSSPANATMAAIRDTKVVKKKKAELPQRNLPHPTPKFGDWLNSRTMINNYIILETLGTGGYAEVKLCKEKLSGRLFAMKFISRDVMKKDKLGKQSKLDDIKREIAIMKKLHHPNVLRLYEVMDDPKMNKLFLVLEYMKHGDMLSYQKKKHPQGMLENLRDRDLHSVFLQVVLGLAYLHEQKIVHGDIKPQNLLVGEKDVVKIADFGISQSLYGSKQKLMDTAGTPAFMSPEMCSGGEYSGQLADIWALGATIFMLKFGSPPFVAKSAMQMFEKIQNDPLVFPSAIEPLLAHLLTGMLTKIPQKRFTLLEVMTHPWVTKDEKHTAKLEAAHLHPAPQITVSSDEIEHAMDVKDHFSILVNIRVQMLKRLKQARIRLAEREKADQEEAELGATGASQVKATSPRSLGTRSSSKVLAASSDDQTRDSLPRAERQMLSNEEICYRSQLFSRKKPSNKNALDVASPGGSSEHLADAATRLANTHPTNRLLAMNGADDDDDNFSSDDDELAVSQSPQLLDELLLTTLSMPPLATNMGAHGDVTSQFRGQEGGSTGSPAFGRMPVGSISATSDEQSFYGESPTLGAQYGVSSLQGRRSSQEDRWIVLPTVDMLNASSSAWAAQTAYIGLYDGHGGDECANILHEQLHTWMFRSLDAPALSPRDLRSCFETLDASICDYLLQKDDLSGSTATSVVLRPTADGRLQLTIAHVGDCRLVLSKRNENTVELTQDHRLTLEAERQRVLELGGRVVNNRVNGVMAITRGFGDLEFKGLLGRGTGSAIGGFGVLSSVCRDDEKVPALLTARPDVHELVLDPAEDDFLILACDGLWDVLTSEEATTILRDRLCVHGRLQLAAQELAQEGIRRYSNDNITVVAILLQPSLEAAG